MTDTETTSLETMVANLVKGAAEFKAEFGSCRVTVGPNSPFAQARIEQVAGYPIHVEELRLISMKGEREETAIDGDLIYYRKLDERVTQADVASSIGWLDGFGNDIDFSSADWQYVADSGRVYLEGRRDNLIIDVTVQIVDISVGQEDAFEDFDYDDEDES